MTRISALLFVLVFCFATAMQAQAQAPKPDPELKKLSVLAGHWTYEGELKPGPLGQAGKFTGEQHARMILGGFYLETRTHEKDVTAEVESLEIDRYDSVGKTFTYAIYNSDGSVALGVYNLPDEHTWSFSGKYDVGGKRFFTRGTNVYTADFMSYTQKGEVSTDGKTWVPGWEQKAVKAKPGPNK